MHTELPVSARLRFVLEELEKILLDMEAEEDRIDSSATVSSDFLTR